MLARRVARLRVPRSSSKLRRAYSSSSAPASLSEPISPPKNSGATPGGGKPVSPHIGFYKVYGRPIAKVFLGAVFTYQAMYWLWAKLERDELRAEKEAEINELEQKLREVSAKQR